MTSAKEITRVLSVQNRRGGVGAANLKAVFHALDAEVFKVIDGTSYTLLASDAGMTLRTTSASPVSITVTTDFTRSVPAGSDVEVMQDGAGQVTFVASGVTINSAESLKIAKQHARVMLTLTDVQDVLSLAGYLEAA